MYSLVSENQDTISERVSSFWVHLHFTIQNRNAPVRLDAAHVAVYLTYDFSEPELKKRHGHVPFPGNAAPMVRLDIIGDQPTTTLGITRASLVRKITIRRSNEVGELLFFKIADPGGAVSWLETENWGPDIDDPQENEDNSQFLPLRITLGDAENGGIANRFVHELAMDTSNAGLKRLAVVVDMLGKPLLAQVTAAALAGATFPNFSIIPVNANLTEVIGAKIRTSTGYAMGAVGAFAHIDADILLSDWNTNNPDVLLDKLSRVLFAPGNVAGPGPDDPAGPDRLVRKLHNVGDTSRSDSQYLRHIENVREVLYIEAAGNGRIANEIQLG
ncbi:hypothetical protein [Mesorhizobium caraganae]|uniref:hypothetical protein n=1 Tax=Mesorhizobium caraganae TaxID=483206 RepID=UPI00333CDA03